MSKGKIDSRTVSPTSRTEFDSGEDSDSEEYGGKKGQTLAAVNEMIKVLDRRDRGPVSKAEGYGSSGLTIGDDEPPYEHLRREYAKQAEPRKLEDEFDEAMPSSEGKIDPKIKSPTSRVNQDRSRGAFKSDIASRVAEMNAYKSGEQGGRGPTNKFSGPWPGYDDAGDDHREGLVLSVDPTVLEGAFKNAGKKPKTRASQRARAKRKGLTGKRAPRGPKGLAPLRF